jgi:RNA-directed DNA polymerase
MKTLYTESIWEAYCKKTEEDYHSKTYPHFDPIFNFEKNKNTLKKIVSDPTLSKVARHDFLPFVKILQKTPRYKLQINDADPDGGEYDLETKIRPISFASHLDTYLYSFYAFALNSIYQKYLHDNGLNEVVLAYRSDMAGKCNIQFAKETFDEVRNMFIQEGNCAVIALDIKGYFDNIQHKKLKEMWSRVIGEDDLPKDQYHIYRSLTKYSYINLTSFLKAFNINLNKIRRKYNKSIRVGEIPKHEYNSLLDLVPDSHAGATLKDKMKLLRQRLLITENSHFDEKSKKRVLKEKGIPQGSAMSAVLSNIYLLEFDHEVCKKGAVEGFIYRRYCDDLLIICKPEMVNDIKSFLIDKIRSEFYLTIQEEKTDVIDFKKAKNGKTRSFRRTYDKTTNCFLETTNDEKNYKNSQYLGFEYNGQQFYLRSSSLSRYFRKMKARILKTVGMAYSRNSKADVIFKKELFKRYSHLGDQNFILYALNASKEYYINLKGERKVGFNSPSIRRQISAHMRILKQEIEKTSGQRAKKKGLSTILK